MTQLKCRPFWPCQRWTRTHWHTNFGMDSFHYPCGLCSTCDSSLVELRQCGCHLEMNKNKKNAFWQKWVYTKPSCKLKSDSTLQGSRKWEWCQLRTSVYVNIVKGSNKEKWLKQQCMGLWRHWIMYLQLIFYFSSCEYQTVSYFTLKHISSRFHFNTFPLNFRPSTGIQSTQADSWLFSCSDCVKSLKHQKVATHWLNLTTG